MAEPSSIRARILLAASAVFGVACAAWLVARVRAPEGGSIAPAPRATADGTREPLRAEVEAPAAAPARTPAVPAGPKARGPGGPFVDEPPGTVLVPGGPTWVGSNPEEVEALARRAPGARRHSGPLAGETPRHRVVVDTFLLMVTEVTNEQYERFLRATGRRAPPTWGRAAIEAAREDALAREARARGQALLQGLDPLPARPFDGEEWWIVHGREAEWAVPAGEEAHPVGSVAHADALAYARWAGMRLMSEAEYQRACRGATERSWPWGDDPPNHARAATAELEGRPAPRPVGCFPAGASEQGCFDLAGNLWEWTSSAYLPFPGHEPVVSYRPDARGNPLLHEAPTFSEHERVAVGGSFDQPSWVARCTTRRGADPDRLSASLGFRCAASRVPGRDRLVAELERGERPFDELIHVPGASTGMDRWVASTPPERPPGYALVEEYQYVAFAPAYDGPEPRPKVEPTAAPRFVHAGVLATNLAAFVSAPRPGVWYVVADRGEGRVEGRAWTALAARLSERSDYEPGRTALVLIDPDGAIGAVVPAAIHWTNAFEVPSVAIANGRELLLEFDAFMSRADTLSVRATLEFHPAVMAGKWRE